MKAAALVLLWAGSAWAGPRWEQAFPARGPVPVVQARAHYTSPSGQEHRLTLWRDGDRRLVRRTDDRLTLYVSRARDDYEYWLLDSTRHLQYRISRSNLYRLGTFSDWPSLATLLSPPRAAYTLARGAEETTALGRCRWYTITITQKGARQRVCWSARYRLPLRIEAADGDRWRPTLVVEEVVDRVDPQVFERPIEGYQTLDANRDLDQD